MKLDKRQQRFSAGLNKLIERAEVSDTELGRRISMTRLTVQRWRKGETLPNDEAIRKLKLGLRWVDSGGVIHELTDAEVRQLLVAAGYLQASLHANADFDQITRTDRCVVYTHRYLPEGFPSRW